MLPKHSLFQSARPRLLSARALACHVAGERMMTAFARFQAFAEKAGFNPDQPRAQGGGRGSGRGGGQWIYVEGYAQGRQPGIGDNGGPKLDPEERAKEPSKKKHRPLRQARRWRRGSHGSFCDTPGPSAL